MTFTSRGFGIRTNADAQKARLDELAKRVNLGKPEEQAPTGPTAADYNAVAGLVPEAFPAGFEPLPERPVDPEQAAIDAARARASAYLSAPDNAAMQTTDIGGTQVRSLRPGMTWNFTPDEAASRIDTFESALNAGVNLTPAEREEYMAAQATPGVNIRKGGWDTAGRNLFVGATGGVAGPIGGAMRFIGENAGVPGMAESGAAIEESMAGQQARFNPPTKEQLDTASGVPEPKPEWGANSLFQVNTWTDGRMLDPKWWETLGAQNWVKTTGMQGLGSFAGTALVTAPLSMGASALLEAPMLVVGARFGLKPGVIRGSLEIADRLGLGGGDVVDALTEAATAYSDARREGKSIDEANRIAGQVSAMNVATNVALGSAGEVAAKLKGAGMAARKLNNLLRRSPVPVETQLATAERMASEGLIQKVILDKVKSAIIAGAREGLQEAQQGNIQDTAKDDTPWDVMRAYTSGKYTDDMLAGALLGGGSHLVGSMRTMTRPSGALGIMSQPQKAQLESVIGDNPVFKNLPEESASRLEDLKSRVSSGQVSFDDGLQELVDIAFELPPEHFNAIIPKLDMLSASATESATSDSTTREMTDAEEIERIRLRQRKSLFNRANKDIALKGEKSNYAGWSEDIKPTWTDAEEERLKFLDDLYKKKPKVSRRPVQNSQGQLPPQPPMVSEELDYSKWKSKDLLSKLDELTKYDVISFSPENEIHSLDLILEELNKRERDFQERQGQPPAPPPPTETGGAPVDPEEERIRRLMNLDDPLRPGSKLIDRYRSLASQARRGALTADQLRNDLFDRIQDDNNLDDDGVSALTDALQSLDISAPQSEAAANAERMYAARDKAETSDVFEKVSGDLTSLSTEELLASLQEILRYKQEAGDQISDDDPYWGDSIARIGEELQRRNEATSKTPLQNRPDAGAEFGAQRRAPEPSTAKFTKPEQTIPTEQADAEVRKAVDEFLAQNPDIKISKDIIYDQKYKDFVQELTNKYNYTSIYAPPEYNEFAPWKVPQDSARLAIYSQLIQGRQQAGSRQPATRITTTPQARQKFANLGMTNAQLVQYVPTPSGNNGSYTLADVTKAENLMNAEASVAGEPVAEPPATEQTVAEQPVEVPAEPPATSRVVKFEYPLVQKTYEAARENGLVSDEDILALSPTGTKGYRAAELDAALKKNGQAVKSGRLYYGDPDAIVKLKAIAKPAAVAEAPATATEEAKPASDQPPAPPASAAGEAKPASDQPAAEPPAAETPAPPASPATAAGEAKPATESATRRPIRPEAETYLRTNKISFKEIEPFLIPTGRNGMITRRDVKDAHDSYLTDRETKLAEGAKVSLIPGISDAELAESSNQKLSNPGIRAFVASETANKRPVIAFYAGRTSTKNGIGQGPRYVPLMITAIQGNIIKVVELFPNAKNGEPLYGQEFDASMQDGDKIFIPTNEQKQKYASELTTRRKQGVTATANKSEDPEKLLKELESNSLLYTSEDARMAKFSETMPANPQPRAGIEKVDETKPETFDGKEIGFGSFSYEDEKGNPKLSRYATVNQDSWKITDEFARWYAAREAGRRELAIAYAKTVFGPRGELARYVGQLIGTASPIDIRKKPKYPEFRKEFVYYMFNGQEVRDNLAMNISDAKGMIEDLGLNSEETQKVLEQFELGFKAKTREANPDRPDRPKLPSVNPEGIRSRYWTTQLQSLYENGVAWSRSEFGPSLKYEVPEIRGGGTSEGTAEAKQYVSGGLTFAAEGGKDYWEREVSKHIDEARFKEIAGEPAAKNGYKFSQIQDVVKKIQAEGTTVRTYSDIQKEIAAEKKPDTGTDAGAQPTETIGETPSEQPPARRAQVRALNAHPNREIPDSARQTEQLTKPKSGNDIVPIGIIKGVNSILNAGDIEGAMVYMRLLFGSISNLKYPDIKVDGNPVTSAGSVSDTDEGIGSNLALALWANMAGTGAEANKTLINNFLERIKKESTGVPEYARINRIIEQTISSLSSLTSGRLSSQDIANDVMRKQYGVNPDNLATQGSTKAFAIARVKKAIAEQLNKALQASLTDRLFGSKKTQSDNLWNARHGSQAAAVDQAVQGTVEAPASATTEAGGAAPTEAEAPASEAPSGQPTDVRPSVSGGITFAAPGTQAYWDREVSKHIDEARFKELAGAPASKNGYTYPQLQKVVEKIRAEGKVVREDKEVSKEIAAEKRAAKAKATASAEASAAAPAEASAEESAQKPKDLDASGLQNVPDEIKAIINNFNRALKLFEDPHPIVPATASNVMSELLAALNSAGYIVDFSTGKVTETPASFGKITQALKDYTDSNSSTTADSNADTDAGTVTDTTTGTTSTQAQAPVINKVNLMSSLRSLVDTGQSNDIINHLRGMNLDTAGKTIVQTLSRTSKKSPEGVRDRQFIIDNIDKIFTDPAKAQVVRNMVEGKTTTVTLPATPVNPPAPPTPPVNPPTPPTPPVNPPAPPTPPVNPPVNPPAPPVNPPAPPTPPVNPPTPPTPPVNPPVNPPAPLPVPPTPPPAGPTQTLWETLEAWRYANALSNVFQLATEGLNATVRLAELFTLNPIEGAVQGVFKKFGAQGEQTASVGASLAGATGILDGIANGAVNGIKAFTDPSAVLHGPNTDIKLLTQSEIAKNNRLVKYGFTGLELISTRPRLAFDMLAQGIARSVALSTRAALDAQNSVGSISSQAGQAKMKESKFILGQAMAWPSVMKDSGQIMTEAEYIKMLGNVSSQPNLLNDIRAAQYNGSQAFASDADIYNAAKKAYQIEDDARSISNQGTRQPRLFGRLFAGNPVAKNLVLFTNWLARESYRGLSYTPGVGAGLMLYDVQTGKYKDIEGGASKWIGTPTDPRTERLSKRVAMQIMGTMVLAGGFTLRAMGGMNGDGPEEPEERSAWLAEGNIPYALTWYNPDGTKAQFKPSGVLGALMYPLVAGAIVHDTIIGSEYQSPSKVRDVLDKVRRLSVQYAEWMYDNSTLRNYNEIMNALQANNYGELMNRIIANQVLSYVPASGLMRGISAVSDKYMRNPDDVLDYISNSLPTDKDAIEKSQQGGRPQLNMAVKPKRDEFGRPVKNQYYAEDTAGKVAGLFRRQFVSTTREGSQKDQLGRPTYQYAGAKTKAESVRIGGAVNAVEKYLRNPQLEREPTAEEYRIAARYYGGKNVLWQDARERGVEQEKLDRKMYERK
jgi:hypothetical protein